MKWDPLGLGTRMSIDPGHLLHHSQNSGFMIRECFYWHFICVRTNSTKGRVIHARARKNHSTAPALSDTRDVINFERQKTILPATGGPNPGATAQVACELSALEGNSFLPATLNAVLYVRFLCVLSQPLHIITRSPLLLLLSQRSRTKTHTHTHISERKSAGTTEDIFILISERAQTRGRGRIF